MNLKKVILLVFGFLAFGMLALGVLAAIFVPRFVKASVVDAAKQRGVVLEPGEVSFGWGWVQLSNAKATLVGVKGLSTEISIVEVELDRIEPKRFTLNGVKLAAVGEPLHLLNRLSAWRKAHAGKFTEPLFVKPFSLGFRRDVASPALLSLQGGTLDVASGRARLSATSVKFDGLELGEMRLSESPARLDLALTLGLSSLDNPLLSIEAREQPSRSVHFALAPVAIGQLNSRFGTKFPLPDVKLSGTLDVAPPPNALFAASGRTDMTLKGYVPPHPVELDGFVFGDTTVVSSRFEIEPDALRVKLEDFRVRAGRFELKGGGQLGWAGDHGRLALSLSGQLPCTELAAATAESRLGRALGRVGGKAARQVLAGSVGIHVAVDADTREPERAQTLKTITPGCGLRALTLAELVALGELVPEALDPRALQDFEKLLGGPLPSLPNLGQDPRLVIPGFPALPFPVLSKPASGAGGKGPTQSTSAGKPTQVPKSANPGSAPSGK